MLQVVVCGLGFQDICRSVGLQFTDGPQAPGRGAVAAGSARKLFFSRKALALVLAIRAVP